MEILKLLRRIIINIIFNYFPRRITKSINPHYLHHTDVLAFELGTLMIFNLNWFYFKRPVILDLHIIHFQLQTPMALSSNLHMISVYSVSPSQWYALVTLAQPMLSHHLGTNLTELCTSSHTKLHMVSSQDPTSHLNFPNDPTHMSLTDLLRDGSFSQTTPSIWG